MQWSLLSTKHNINNLDSLSNSIQTSSEIHTTTDDDNEEYHWHELTISNNDVCIKIAFLKLKKTIIQLF
jgi:hypothetical protein